MKVFLETEPGVDHSSWSEFGINKVKMWVQAYQAC